MKKDDIIFKLKQVQKNCDAKIERDGQGYLIRKTCILHKYLQSIGKEKGTMGTCLGGEKSCGEIQKILGVCDHEVHCPTIHREIYNFIKNYKLPRNLKI